MSLTVQAAAWVTVCLLRHVWLSDCSSLQALLCVPNDKFPNEVDLCVCFGIIWTVNDCLKGPLVVNAPPNMISRSIKEYLVYWASLKLLLRLAFFTDTTPLRVGHNYTCKLTQHPVRGPFPGPSPFPVNEFFQYADLLFPVAEGWRSERKNVRLSFTILWWERAPVGVPRTSCTQRDRMIKLASLT